MIVKPVPEGYHTLTPYLIVDDVDRLIDFLKAAFDATEKERMPGKDGRTGHAEVVRVVFDPARVVYETLLDHFWRMHDPTQVNRQGPDIGTQYRSVIFYGSDAQKAAATASKAVLVAAGHPIATGIEPTATYWPAEDYHQQYFEKNRRIHGGLFGA